MADIAKNTVKVGERYFAPGEVVEGLSAADRKLLLEAEAITVTDDKPAAKKGKGE